MPVNVLLLGISVFFYQNQCTAVTENILSSITNVHRAHNIGFSMH